MKIPYWKTELGQIRCLGDDCQETCDDRCPIYLNTKASTLMMMKRHEEAIEIYKKAIEIESNFSDLYCNIATCYGVLSEYKLALDNYIKAFELNPRKMMYARGIAFAYRDLGEYEKAIEYCDICDSIEFDMLGKVDAVREFCMCQLNKKR